MPICNMNFILALAFFGFHFFLANAASQCYMLNGDLATSDFQPCTSNLASGSNSACCNLGKNPPDICLGGGLCQRMDSTEGNFVIYAVGCTDRSGKDPACPQYCPNKVEEYSLNPCYNAPISSWCCNDQSLTTCCGSSTGGSFTFNLTSLGLSNQQQSQSSITGTTNTSAGTCTSNAVSCPVGKGAVIGGSVGSFFAGTIIAGLLGLYLAERRLRKHSQTGGAVPDIAVSHVSPRTEWRSELPSTTHTGVPRPRPGTDQNGIAPPKYEMEGRQVFERP